MSANMYDICIIGVSSSLHKISDETLKQKLLHACVKVSEGSSKACTY